jgi:hypothetical protein
VLAAYPSSIHGHELRPAYLELREAGPGEFDVLWKTPMRGEFRLSLAPEISGAVGNTTPVMTYASGEAAVQTWTIRAPELRGSMLRIAGLEATMTDALARIEFADGTNWVQRLTPSRPSATVPLRQTRREVALQYGRLGTEHILTGADHLLFVLTLIFMVPAGLKLLKTITAFTLSHTVTLTAATLGWVNLQQRPVEAVIALSIVVAAVEIVHRQQGRQGLATRAPWLLSFGFGLLHGLGYAGGLAEAGLPTGHIPEALLFFSIGVEFGHLLFIGAVLVPLALARRISTSLPPWTERVPPYAIGSLAVFWMIQRVTLF